MFELGSRYDGIETATATEADPSGEPAEVVYVRRRLIPPPAGSPVAAHRVAEGDRLDLLAARYLGDPTLFWRLCDANVAHRPHELTAEPGRTVEIHAEGV